LIRLHPLCALAALRLCVNFISLLRGERLLTLAHVRTLAKRFRVSADLFLP
jgi:antitoxin component HigA of HigAB toxin-antitoxin module